MPTIVCGDTDCQSAYCREDSTLGLMPYDAEHPEHQKWLEAMEVDKKNLGRLQELVRERIAPGEFIEKVDWSDYQVEHNEEPETGYEAWVALVIEDEVATGLCELSHARTLSGEALEAHLSEQADWLIKQVREEL